MLAQHDTVKSGLGALHFVGWIILLISAWFWFVPDVLSWTLKVFGFTHVVGVHLSPEDDAKNTAFFRVWMWIYGNLPWAGVLGVLLIAISRRAVPRDARGANAEADA